MKSAMIVGSDQCLKGLDDCSVGQLSYVEDTWFHKSDSEDEKMIVDSPGGLPYKEDGVARWKFGKEPIRSTKILFCGRGLKFFTPKRNQF